MKFNRKFIFVFKIFVFVSVCNLDAFSMFDRGKSKIFSVSFAFFETNFEFEPPVLPFSRQISILNCVFLSYLDFQLFFSSWGFFFLHSEKKLQSWLESNPRSLNPRTRYVGSYLVSGVTGVGSIPTRIGHIEPTPFTYLGRELKGRGFDAHLDCKFSILSFFSRQISIFYLYVLDKFGLSIAFFRVKFRLPSIFWFKYILTIKSEMLVESV